jgi:hypothetical protein
MINGIGLHPLCGAFLPEVALGHGRFRPNGSGSITVYAGDLIGLFTAAETATGEYTVTLDPKLKFKARPPVIIAQAICADMADNLFHTTLVGDWDGSTQQFVIGTFQNSSGVDTATDMPSDANNWLEFFIIASTTTARR